MVPLSPLGPQATAGERRRSSKRAPLGIKLLCLAGSLTGLIATRHSVPMLAAGGLSTAVGGLLLVGAVVQIIGFYGLWTLEFWGWAVVLALYLIGIAVAAVMLNAWGIVVQCTLAYYVFRQNEYYV